MDPQPTPTHCPACFAGLKSASCFKCGWRRGGNNRAPCLPQGIVLDGRYKVGRVLGHGGFGITYLGWDIHLKTRRAIKEYLPSDLATRAIGETWVAVFTGERERQFNDGLKRFLNEAEHLARFERHPGIVNVVSYFSAHATGYMVMEYLDGFTLRDYLKQQGGRIDLPTAISILMPVMDALGVVHKAGLLHRDIAPDNIHITRHGHVKLLDFGAARQSTQVQSRSLSVVLKPGYAPEEQYRSRARQGPAADVYALTATLYRAITGETPPEALERRPGDSLRPPSHLGVSITPTQEAVILKGLTLEAPGRYQDIAGLQQALRAVCLGMQPPPPGEDHKPSPWLTIPPRRPVWRIWLPWALTSIFGATLLISLVRPFEERLPAGGDGEPQRRAEIEPRRRLEEQRQRKEAKPAVLDRLRDRTTGMEFIRIPGGCYQMGSNSGNSDEKPMHEVCVDDFRLGKHEVTQGQWMKVMGENPSKYNNGDDYPVEQVSWDDVQAYIDRLNAQGNAQYRLPTEAEWEYACRGGGKDEIWAGTSTKDRLDQYANICDQGGNCGFDWKESGLDDGYPNTSPVGHFTANDLGLYDMSGNVWEWVQGIYTSDAYSSHSKNNPLNTRGGFYRVNRGGGWYYNAAYARCAKRYISAPGRRNDSLGFRLLRKQ